MWRYVKYRNLRCKDTSSTATNWNKKEYFLKISSETPLVFRAMVATFNGVLDIYFIINLNKIYNWLLL